MAGFAELYVLISPVAASFSGFGSVVSGLGQRRGGSDSRVDAMRLGSMLSASLSATLLSLLPATIGALCDNEVLGVRASAFVAVINIAIAAPIHVRRSLQIRNLPGHSKAAFAANSVCAIIALASFVLCALAVPVARIEALYLSGLVGLLGSSVVMFNQVIASMLRAFDEHADAG